MKPRGRAPRIKKEEAKDEWYSIRGILRERRAKGRVEYLVDWDDDPVTGQSHDPTWTPRCDVTDAARREWEAKKAHQRNQAAEDKGPAKRKRATNARTTSSGRRGADEDPQKAPKLSHSVPRSEQPPSSLTAGEASFTPQAALSPRIRRSQTLVVEIPQRPLFDTSEFVSFSESQLTVDNDDATSSSQSLPKVEQTHYKKSVVTSQESRLTIPDSQEPSGQTVLSAGNSLDTQKGPLPDSHQTGPETSFSSPIPENPPPHSSPAPENPPHLSPAPENPLHSSAAPENPPRQCASSHRLSTELQRLPDYETPSPVARDTPDNPSRSLLAPENSPRQPAASHRLSVELKSSPDCKRESSAGPCTPELLTLQGPARSLLSSPDYPLQHFASWSQHAYRRESPYSPLSPSAAEAVAAQVPVAHQSPVFASQLPTRHAFDLPETSSSGTNLVPATQTDGATQTDDLRQWVERQQRDRESFSAEEQDEDFSQDSQSEASIKTEEDQDAQIGDYPVSTYQEAGPRSLSYYADNVLPSVESGDFGDGTVNQELHDSGTQSLDSHLGVQGANSPDYRAEDLSTESLDRSVGNVGFESPDYRPDEEFLAGDYRPEALRIDLPEEEEDFISDDESVEREFALRVAERRQALAEAAEAHLRDEQIEAFSQSAQAEDASQLAQVDHSSQLAQVDHSSQHAQVGHASQRAHTEDASQHALVDDASQRSQRTVIGDTSQDAQEDHASQRAHTENASHHAQVVDREQSRSQPSPVSAGSGSGRLSPVRSSPPAAPADHDTSMADESQDPPPANQELGAQRVTASASAPRQESEHIIQNRERVKQHMHDLIRLHSGPSAPPITPSPIGTRVQNMFNTMFPPTPNRQAVASSAQNATVSPADISKSMPSPTPAPTTSNTIGDGSQATPPMGQGLIPEQSSSNGSTNAVPAPCQREHVVTLPFQASQRPCYDETLVNSKRVVTELNTIFSNETWVEPTDSLVRQVDELLGLLFNACDFPPDAVGSLAHLPASQMAKYSCDANSKFNFIFELLQGVRKDTKVLIIARSAPLLRLLSYLTEALELECTCEAIGKLGSATSPAQITLALPSENVNITEFDVVVGFDHSYAAWRASSSLPSDLVKKPLMMHLVTTHSIEHISLHVPGNLSPVEHKNALLSSVVRARQLINDPERGYLEPHEIASKFVDHINDTADTIACEPVPIPDEVLLIFCTPGDGETSETSSSPSDGRKRKHDGTAENAQGETSDDARAKRARLLSDHGANQPPLPDEVQTLLRKMGVDTPSGRPGDMQVNVTLGVLQTLSEKFAECERRAAANDAEAEYKAVISRLETQVKEYERSIDEIYKSNRKALEDRSRFEDEKSKAEAALGRKQAKIIELEAELEAVVKRLTDDPNGNEEETPLARTNRLLQEANNKEEQLKKRLQNAQADTNYIKDRYQEASSSAAAAQEENAQLRAQTEVLRRKASDNVVRVQQIHQESETRALAHAVSGLKAQLKERDWEVDRVREELRQLKNGRRETRQVSVPRSPHTGMMSPHLQARANGAGSRGTSPSVGIGQDGVGASSGAQFMNAQQAGNGRWNHLRD
ncbi:hypothetical protein CP533_5129 [Ophiocordyceps camponoti-saundersi (nom. inval.)]|nr:hypothetical protein CP533_5129 [Ophiocordyceps camponoti-saundersi (nom. inval.)]